MAKKEILIERMGRILTIFFNKKWKNYAFSSADDARKAEKAIRDTLLFSGDWKIEPANAKIRNHFIQESPD